MTTPTTPSDDLEAAAVRADLEAMANLCSAPMDLWDRFSNGVLSLIYERLADKARIAELEGAWPCGAPEKVAAYSALGCDVIGDAKSIVTVMGWRHDHLELPAAEAAQARAEFLLAVMAACAEQAELEHIDEANSLRARALERASALRASQDALEGALSADFRAIALGALKDAHRAGESHEMAARWVAERIRQTLAQVEGVEGHGALPGSVTSDQCTSSGQGSGS